MGFFCLCPGRQQTAGVSEKISTFKAAQALNPSKSAPMEETRSPLVTAIIPFYNDDAYLAETIESVIHQDFTDWELLLIDDGSSDNSTAIAKKYAAASGGKIIYVEHPGHTNKGVCV